MVSRLLQLLLLTVWFSNSYASQNIDIICPKYDLKDLSILIPHPSDCTKFYECSNGVSVLEKCPPGLEFNPILFVCDWPNRAGCVHGCAPLIVEDGSSWEPTSCVDGKSEFGAECSIRCASGYERSDIVTIQCTTDGWNSTDGTDCADGYERSGSDSIQCTGDGWNSTDGINFIPSCKKAQGCAPLNFDEGSSWAPTSCVNGKSDIGTECSIQCADGYERSGSVSVQCTTDGWNSTDGLDVIPTCKHTPESVSKSAKDGCAPLSFEEGSSWAPTSCVSGKNDIGTECSIQCADDYEWSGSVSVQCTTEGWNSTDGLDIIPSCKHTQGCAPLNVEVCSSWAPTSCTNGNSDIGTVCSIHCVDGYERCGSVNVQCTADGWNSTDGLNVIPSCKYIEGCAPLNVEEGSLWITDILCQRIQCVDGYERSGSVSVQCTADGWNSTSGLNVMPTCNHIQGCAPLNVEEGSLWIPTSCVNDISDFGTECIILCAEDYERSVCVPLNVEDGSLWTPTYCISDNTKIGTECSIQCAHGYERSGSVSIQCTADGWNSTTGLDVIPSCNHTQRCAPLNVEEGSFWEPTSCINSTSDIGTECSIQCNDGYERSGSVSVQCTSDGWNSTDGLTIIPSCKLIPGCTPLSIKNGSSWAPPSCVNGYNDIGTECNIECADGYERSGNDHIQCTADGWNSTAGLNVMPSCKLITGCYKLG
ncbi:unnamed protein product [Timema podura]|uniref:Uncharacterized protein n=1 Tax=Timema podura TaxID=61482 RepID=A0ABN7P5E3_TIMPD|nr:unnamed protein product [Timema podura]